MRISAIKIHNRHRKSLGDIDSLAASIKAVGLLHPVVIDADAGLIAGERRIAAAKMLGWVNIETTTATKLDDIAKALRAERDENTCREPFAPSEMVSMAEALRPFEEKSAKERQKDHGGTKPGTKNTSEKFTEVNGRAADRVAEAVGVSRPTLEKARAIVHAAKSDPKHYGDLPAKMDEIKKVDPVHKEMLERAAKFPIPDGPTPAQIAKNSPAARWAKNIHECWVVLNSIRDNGGIDKLSRSWSDDERDNYLVELKQFRTAADQWIRSLESLCPKRKSA